MIFVFKLFFQPLAIVLPHHDLVKDTRLDFLRSIFSERPLTKHIIIIGPDHFSPFQTGISYSDLDWDIADTSFKFDQQLFSKINFPLTLQNGIIRNDHAIYNVIPDLKNFWPQAQIIPILVGQKFPLAKLDGLVSELDRLCSFNCLLIASVDFSHYLPASLADTHDAFTLRTLNNLDLENINKIEVDSPQSLYVLTKFSQLKNAQKWSLFAHTNSGAIAHNPDLETTTHIFGFYSRSPFVKKDSTFTTLTLPYIIDRQSNQDTLGDRFFYGVGKTNVNLSDKFVIATINTQSKIISSFLPVTKRGDRISFITGAEKQLLIKKYFDTLPDSQNLTKDYFWGRLIYDR